MHQTSSPYRSPKRARSQKRGADPTTSPAPCASGVTSPRAGWCTSVFRMSILAPLHEALIAVRAQTSTVPVVGVVLGSGLGAWADSLQDSTRLPYSGIPNMPVSTIVGHAGNLCVGYSGDVPVACL